MNKITATYHHQDLGALILIGSFQPDDPATNFDAQADLEEIWYSRNGNKQELYSDLFTGPELEEMAACLLYGQGFDACSTFYKSASALGPVTMVEAVGETMVFTNAN